MSSFVSILLTLLAVSFAAAAAAADTECKQNETASPLPLSLVKAIIHKYTQSDSMDYGEFVTFFNSLAYLAAPVPGDGGRGKPATPKCINTLLNDTCMYKSKDIFEAYAVNSRLDPVSLLHALPAVVAFHERQHCGKGGLDEHGALGVRRRQPPPKEQIWGYGVGFVVLVCLVSNLGGLMAPFTKYALFERFLMFLVSVAVGTLTATGLIVLIPESMELITIEHVADTYIWKMSSVVGAIVFFYLTERILQGVVAGAKRKREKGTENEGQVLEVKTGQYENGHGHSHLVPAASEKDGDEGDKGVRPVAWMMLLGDGLHKFVDGLSIGAAYSQSIRTGLTLTIAILCEELPHELGDIAILLHSGMSMKRALLCNTLSAAISLAGLVAGIYLGEVASSSSLWIFAVAAGIFIYVPLVDMLPEMSHAATKAVEEGSSAVLITAIQILGLCIGFSIILIVAVYSGDIDV